MLSSGLLAMCSYVKKFRFVPEVLPRPMDNSGGAVDPKSELPLRRSALSPMESLDVYAGQADHC